MAEIQYGVQNGGQSHSVYERQICTCEFLKAYIQPHFSLDNILEFRIFLEISGFRFFLKNNFQHGIQSGVQHPFNFR